MSTRRHIVRLFVPMITVTAGLALLPGIAAANVVNDFVSAAQAATGDGWAIHPDQDGDATEAFVEGPLTPPVGRGSLEMTTPNDADRALIFAVPKPPSEPTPWAGSSGGYSTFTSEGTAISVPILKLIGYQVFNTDNPVLSTGFTTLNFPGAIQPGGVQAEVWQTWTLEPTSLVWQSNSDDAFCGQDAPCTFEEFGDEYPDGAWGQIQLGLGNGAPDSRGFVDAVSISDGSATFEYDFEVGSEDNSTATITKGAATAEGGTVDVTLNASSVAADSVVFTVNVGGEAVDEFEVQAGETAEGTVPVPFGTSEVTVTAQDVVIASETVAFPAPATTDPTNPPSTGGTSASQIADTGGSADLALTGLLLLAIGIAMVMAGRQARNAMRS